MKQLSILEKCKLLVSEDTFSTYGINDEIFSIKVSDGPVGLRMPTKQFPLGKPTYCLPSVTTIANSWNKDVAYNIGKVLASQCINENVDIILAPGVNIKRTPLCGRNFEYFSEDPYLAGKLASQYVNGVQDLGIGTSVKHFCCNNREFDRLFQSSDVDKRTLKEIYTKQFEIIIKEANPWTIMGSYNPVNGVNVSENKYILNHVLRDELNYQNVIISDWGAVKDRVNSLKASLDIQFPNDEQSINKLVEAYNNNIITDKEIDESIERIAKLCQKIKDNKHKRIPLNDEKIEEICVNALCEGSVLLKNDDGILPLKGNEKIAVLGWPSHQPYHCGGGSAMIYLKDQITPLIDELRKQMPEATLDYSKMYAYESCILSLANITTMDLQRGYNLAYDSDVAILVVGTNQIIETESYDRTSLKLDEKMEEMIIEVAKKNKNTIVILQAGCVIDVTNWIDSVKALLYTGFGGTYINKALAKLISGKANPSGRLAETFPLCLEDTPTESYKGNGYAEVYSEGIMVGYRWYDQNELEVMYPFGYGLSYSTFEYENPSIKKISDTSYELSIDVINTSNIAGSEVIQLYVSNIDMKVMKAPKELKRFEKVFLNSHERKTVIITVEKDCFEYFNVCYDSFHVDEGRYELTLATSARDYIKTFKIKI